MSNMSKERQIEIQEDKLLKLAELLKATETLELARITGAIIDPMSAIKRKVLSDYKVRLRNQAVSVINSINELKK